MANTIRKEILDKLADIRKKELEAPNIYELSLMTLKQQKKRIKEWVKSNAHTN